MELKNECGQGIHLRRITLVINLKKDQVMSVADRLEAWFNARQIAVLRCAQDATGSQLALLLDQPDEHWQQTDLIIVLGGDGTLLHSARAAASYRIPILGINMGHLGFLTEVELGDMFLSLEKLLAGEFRLEERMMLSCRLVRDGRTLGEYLALNDVVVTKGSFARLVAIGLYIGQQYVDTYSADGLIVSSPTGSTAYSLSAGGPIVSPDLKLMLLTPICPHTLYSRPMVIGSENQVKLVLQSELAEVMLTFDGQLAHVLEKGDEVIIAEAGVTTRLVRLGSRSFFDILREKMHEGGGGHPA